MELQERIARFYVEYHQGRDPQKLLHKYNLGDILYVEDGNVVASALDGMKIIYKMNNLDPKSVVQARKSTD